MKKKLLSTFLLLMIAMATFAQERTVTGTVTGRDDGLPIPGVSIKVKGTTTGTQSGPNGRFSINVSGANPVLVFSFIGYTTQEASASGSTVNVALAVDNQQLSEIIVTALGVTREQKSLGYSVGKVDSEALTVAKSNDLSSSLAGKVAGVQLQGSPSSTFDNANIIVRGINGLGVGNPLYIVDGTPTLQENVIMDNVDNISVLKGAAATALYGNRAANG
ncbi:MAG: carboxypeptidase-like regulatory domain-containing protein, partial [Bacteroidota bacterium]